MIVWQEFVVEEIILAWQSPNAYGQKKLALARSFC